MSKRDLTRIARQLLALASEEAEGGPDEGSSAADGRALVDVARLMYRNRRDRVIDLSSELFADPAWDILLDLYINGGLNARVPVSSLCLAACVPQTTALRWIDVLEQRDLIRRSPDPRDHRRTFVSLTASGDQRMTRAMRRTLRLFTFGLPTAV